MRFLFNPKSGNKKVGPIPVSTASRDTCPDSCGLKGVGCYAELGPLGLWWRRLSEGTIPTLNFDQLLDKVKALPKDQLWRYAQAGDLPPEPTDVLRLADANDGRPVIAYTHGRDFGTYRQAADKGFTINLSADSMEEADRFIDEGVPIAVVIPSTYAKAKGETTSELRKRLGGRFSLNTPAGQKVVICPATYADDVSCSSCGLCAKPRKGNAVIGFPAHGASKKRVDVVITRNGQKAVSRGHDSRANI